MFLDLRDGSGAVPPVLQCVLTGKLAKTAEVLQLCMYFINGANQNAAGSSAVT